MCKHFTFRYSVVYTQSSVESRTSLVNHDCATMIRTCACVTMNCRIDEICRYFNLIYLWFR